MSFGGSVSAMIASLKNNARPKRKTYFDRNSTAMHSEEQENPLLKKKATPEQLKQIRETIQQENKRKRRNQILSFSVAVVVIIVFFIYANS